MGPSTISRSKFPWPKNSMEEELLAPQLKEKQRHVWEHAALLYHAYEWQEAASIFARLSVDIDNPRLRSLCLLNTAIISARLGDYDIAARCLHVITELGNATPVVVFLEGIVAYEQQDYFKAECSFTQCLNIMSDKRIDLNVDRFRYVLCKDKVRYNIRQALNAQFSRRGITYSISGVSAEIIFEAPRPIDAAVETTYRRPLGRPIEATLPSVSRRKSTLSSPSPRTDDLSASLKPRRWFRGFLSSLSSQSSSPAFSSTSNNPARRSNDTSSVGMKSRHAAPHFTESQNILHHSWHVKTEARHIPLKPRVRSDNTGEPAKFFRQGLLGGHTMRMVPRAAIGEYPPVEELILDFTPIASQHPDPCARELTTQTQPCSTSKDEDNRSTHFDLKTEPTRPSSLVSQRSIASLIESLLHLYEGSDSDSTAEDPTTEEILQSAVFKPLKRTVSVVKSDRDRGTKASRHAGMTFDREAFLTNDAPSKAYTLHQRAVALQDLERRRPNSKVL